MLILKSKDGHQFNVPTVKKEITLEYIKRITKDIRVPAGKALIACVNSASLREIVNSGQKGFAMNSCPMFVKGDEKVIEDYLPGLKANHQVIMDAGDIERSTYVVAPSNELEANKLIAFVKSDDALSLSVTNGSVFKNASRSAASNVIDMFDTAGRDIVKAPILDTTASQNITYLSFRIVDVADFKGYYDNKEVVNNEGGDMKYILKL